MTTTTDRLSLLTALMLEGGITKIELEELLAMPMTDFLPVTNALHEQVILKASLPRYTDSKPVLGTMTLSKRFGGFVEIKFDKIKPDGNSKSNHMQHPIQMENNLSEFSVPCCGDDCRPIDSHLATGEESSLCINAIGPRSPAGKNTIYQITGLFDSERLNSIGHTQSLEIIMQDSKPTLRSPNGATIECLMAIVIDQLEGLQDGPFACMENSHALTDCKRALNWLHSRTEARIHQGVKNTHETHTAMVDVSERQQEILDGFRLFTGDKEATMEGALIVAQEGNLFDTKPFSFKVNDGVLSSNTAVVMLDKLIAKLDVPAIKDVLEIIDKTTPPNYNHSVFEQHQYTQDRISFCALTYDFHHLLNILSIKTAVIALQVLKCSSTETVNMVIIANLFLDNINVTKDVNVIRKGLAGINTARFSINEQTIRTVDDILKHLKVKTAQNDD